MITITKFVARPISTDAAELSWQIQPASEDIFQYDFQVFRSESPAGPWDTLSPKFKDKFYFIDNQMPPFNQVRHLYYKITVSKGEATSSYTTKLGQLENRYAIEIARLNRVALKVAVGLKLYVLPVRTFGAYCSCYDPVTGKRTVNECLSCYNTGYAGGYLTAIETYGMITTPTKVTQEIPKGGGVEAEPLVTEIRLANYPLLKRGDIIVNPATNDRWRVANVTTPTLAGMVVSQLCRCSLVDPSDIVYKVKLNIEDVFQLVEPVALLRSISSY